ncbi:MAG: glycosyltransferase family 4 protein [Opitutales bacterium]|jgi:glycosyltransferase involved in cell wall biosynthesis|nr:glycosyltransferase family 4 protein [Opitutales bacterium]MDG2255069.1 glycosyltransferase family 4 protein [Opitutaceae bacterium]MBT5816367.1 glycosyltransferase family 4 protein [Opitutales bacterium]MBT6379494.1 glycosyltransferase family 4 protein [Opitutales bacterium]MBT6770762.1 glycosyltransferase family 4 protein [Opitutales bacterium]
MKITFLTPGTGSYYCGACMRDNALANALIQAGHEADLLPMYLPLMLDENSEGMESETPVFFGGINIFLQQKFSLFRHTPKWMDRALNRPSLLRSAAKRSHMTSAHTHGAMCFEMLKLDGDDFDKELKKLYSWINDTGVPDVLCLSTALQAGFAREVKKQWDIPILLCFQGEDSFLDSLPDEYRDECWELMADRCRYADAMLAPSKSYARMMEKRMGLESGSISVHPNGINLEGYSAPREVDPPAIGFLARMCEVKGLGLLVDAFIHLRTDLGDTATRLKIAGAVTLGDVSFIDNLKAKLESAGLTDSVDWHPNISREEKLEFLNELSLFSVPVLYEEAFGLYAIEAMAASVPIVQPDFAAFPELVEATGGGVCVSIETADGLARAYDELLRSPELMKEMGERGRLGVEKRFSMEAMKNSFINAMESLLQSKSV